MSAKYARDENRVTRGKKSLTFATTGEEHLHDEYLQSGHGNHQSALDQAEVEDALLRALDRAEIPILPGAEVLLLPDHGRHL